MIGTLFGKDPECDRKTWCPIGMAQLTHVHIDTIINNSDSHEDINIVWVQRGGREHIE